MRNTIAALLAGIVLGSTGMGAAAGTVYWLRGGNTYRCEGVSAGVMCQENNHFPAYKIYFTPSYASATYGKRAIFGCKRGRAPSQSTCVFEP